jgi:hypothetical protein
MDNHSKLSPPCHHLKYCGYGGENDVHREAANLEVLYLQTICDLFFMIYDSFFCDNSPISHAFAMEIFYAIVRGVKICAATHGTGSLAR